MTTDAGSAERADSHARVRAFIAHVAAGRPPSETFDALGLAIARYQARYVPAYARLLRARGIDPDRARAVTDLPAVPADAFRMTRIAAHPAAADRVVWKTSGTTAALRGAHALSTTETYEAAAVAWGRYCLFPDAPPDLEAVVLVAPDPQSSLWFMIDCFARTFCSRAHVVVTGRIDVDGLVGACLAARSPVVLFGTSFAFVHLLDALAGRELRLPPRSRIMHTGGFKGRSREVDPYGLRHAIARAFGVDLAWVVGEYGMTELSSQLYASGHGAYVPPPWLRVRAVDPETLEPFADARTGLLRFEDLANVDSAVAVQTADQGRVTAEGVELLGRAQGAPARGCSLAMDELLGAGLP